jgi:hypothetical protein
LRREPRTAPLGVTRAFSITSIPKRRPWPGGTYFSRTPSLYSSDRGESRAARLKRPPVDGSGRRPRDGSWPGWKMSVGSWPASSAGLGTARNWRSFGRIVAPTEKA